MASHCLLPISASLFTDVNKRDQDKKKTMATAKMLPGFDHASEGLAQQGGLGSAAESHAKFPQAYRQHAQLLEV